MHKRGNWWSKRLLNHRRRKTRALIGKPSQSDVSVALQLREASERLSSSGFPRAAQLVDVAKPKPERMELDLDLATSPDSVVAPAVSEPSDATLPAPPGPGARGRARAQA